MNLITLFNDVWFLSASKIPSRFLFTWEISENIITGLSLAKDSSKTCGCASVKEGKIKILWLS